MVRINLLSTRRKQIVEKQQKIRQYLRYSLGGLVGMAVVAALAVGTNLWVNWRKNKLEESYTDKEARVLSYADLAEESYRTAERIKAISTIIDSRRGLDKKMDIYDQVFRSVLDLQSLSLGGQTSRDQMEFRGRVRSLLELEEMETRSKEVAEEFGLKEVYWDNISSNNEKTVNLGMVMVINNEEQKK